MTDELEDLASPVAAHRVRERDLDLILMLDVEVGGPLVSGILEDLGLPRAHRTATMSAYRRSDGRETDVEVTWEGGALLIENKISSGLRPGQSASYRQECEERTAGGEMIRAVLICPERHSAHLAAQGGSAFDLVVTCERLLAAAEAQEDDSFSRAASTVLAAAIAPRDGDDPDRSLWGDGYRSVLATVDLDGPPLRLSPGCLRKLTAPAASYVDYAIDPEVVWQLQHRVCDGVVRMELDISPDQVVDLPARVRHVPKARMQWLEIDVREMTLDATPDQQRDLIVEAAEAVQLLRRWVAAHVAPAR